MNFMTDNGISAKTFCLTCLTPFLMKLCLWNRRGRGRKPRQTADKKYQIIIIQYPRAIPSDKYTQTRDECIVSSHSKKHIYTIDA